MQIENDNIIIDCSSDDETIAKSISQYVQQDFVLKPASYNQRPVKHVSSEQTIALQYRKYGFGGAERVVVSLATLFQEMGYQVVLFTDEPPTDQDYPLPEDVKRIVAGVPDWNSLTERILFWRRAMAEYDISAVVYSSWLEPIALLDCLAIQSTGAKFIYHTHGNIPYVLRYTNPNMPPLFTRIGQLADCVLTLSGSDTCFWNVLSTHVRQIVNPVDLYLKDHGTMLPHYRQEAFHVIWCGRLSEYDKRPSDAIRAIAIVQKTIPDVILTIVGAGDAAEELRLHDLAAQLDIERNICFVGFQTDPFPFYTQADLMLLTSSTEGFPLALAEGMHQGLPVVMYDLSHLPLVQSCDGVMQVQQADIKGLADAITTVLRDNTLRRSMGLAARQSYNRVCAVDLHSMWQDIMNAVFANDECVERGNSICGCDELIESTLHHVRFSTIEKNSVNEELRKQISDLTADNDRLRQGIKVLRQSTSYRMGRLLTALPGRLKRILQQR